MKTFGTAVAPQQLWGESQQSVQWHKMKTDRRLILFFWHTTLNKNNMLQHVVMDATVLDIYTSQINYQSVLNTLLNNRYFSYLADWERIKRIFTEKYQWDTLCIVNYICFLPSTEKEKTCDRTSHNFFRRWWDWHRYSTSLWNEREFWKTWVNIGKKECTNIAHKSVSMESSIHCVLII